MFAQPPLWFIVIAFLLAIGPLVVIHELGHVLGGAAVRGRRRAILDWLRARDFRLDRQAWHQMEGRLASAWRLCPLRWRHEPGEPAGSGLCLAPGAASGRLSLQAVVATLPDRACRPDGQFPAGNCDFRGLFRRSRGATNAGRRGAGPTEQRGREHRASTGRPDRIHRRPGNPVLRGHAPGGVDPARRTCPDRDRAAGRIVATEATLGAQEVTDEFGQKFRIGLLGVRWRTTGARTSSRAEGSAGSHQLHDQADPLDDRRVGSNRHGTALDPRISAARSKWPRSPGSRQALARSSSSS